MGAYIKAISYYLPEQVVTNEDLVSEFPEWSVEKVAAKVGVNVRHVAAVGETAGDMPKRQQRNFLKNTLLIQRILIFYCFVRKVLIIICRPQLVYYNID